MYLLIGGLITLLLSYFFFISDTITEVQENKHLEKQVNTENLALKIETNQKRLASLEGKFTAFDKGTDHRKNLSELLLSFSNQNKIVIENFDEPMLEDWEDITIQTDIIKVSGSYQHIIELVYQIEHIQAMGKLASSHFELVKERNTRKLVATLFIQNVKSIDNEKH